jgi:hypothetical protein
MTPPEVAMLLISLASQMSGYTIPPNDTFRVSYATSEVMQAQVCPNTACPVKGTYVDNQIRIRDDADIVNSPMWRAVLVHEMVHYLQDAHDAKQMGKDTCSCACYNRREIEAYGVSNAYLTSVEKLDKMVKYKEVPCEESE